MGSQRGGASARGTGRPAKRRAERSVPAGRQWRLVVARRGTGPGPARRSAARAHRHRFRARWLLLAGGLAVVMVVAGLVTVYQTSLFAVRAVRVEGNRMLAAESVRQAAAVPTGVPLADVDLSAVRRRVAGLAPVRTVRATRQWPHTVLIRISERTAVAAVPDDGRFRLIDRGGVVFRTVSARPAGLPVVVLSHPATDDESTRAVLRVVAALTPALRADLVRIEAPRPTRIRLVLRAGRTVVWGDSSRSGRKAAAATVLLSRDGRVIDVSAPDLVTVR